MGDQHPTNLVKALVSHNKRERHVVKGHTSATATGSIQRQ